MVLCLKHSYQREGDAGKKHGREHHPGERDGQRGGGRIRVIGEEGHQGLGEGHPCQSQPACEQSDDGKEVPCKAQGFVPALFLKVLAEYRDEAPGNGRGKHRVKKHPGDPAGGKKGVGRRAGAVVDGQQTVPVQSQHLADEGEGHHDADGFCRAVLLFQCVHLLTAGFFHN